MFSFDQAQGGWWVNEGVIAVLTIDAANTVRVNLVPIIIEDAATPRFATEVEAVEILDRMLNVSAVIVEGE